MTEETYPERVARIRRAIETEAGVAGVDPLDFSAVLIDVLNGELSASERRISSGLIRAKPGAKH